jgi:N-acetylneuraminic acid mutarotase
MYDICTETWEALPDMHTPRMNATAVAYSGGLFVLGGECDSVFLETVEYYNMKDKTWSFVHRLPQPMAGLRACVYLEETETQNTAKIEK